jgi:hypothetical protein
MRDSTSTFAKLLERAPWVVARPKGGSCSARLGLKRSTLCLLMQKLGQKSPHSGKLR